MTPAEAGWLARVALLHEWKQLIVAGYLTEPGLLAIRTRLDPISHEFEPGADLELLRLLVDEAIARGRGIDVSLMPGRSPVPDTIEELEQ
jgi:hypothetical protein